MSMQVYIDISGFVLCCLVLIHLVCQNRSHEQTLFCLFTGKSSRIK